MSSISRAIASRPSSALSAARAAACFPAMRFKEASYAARRASNSARRLVARRPSRSAVGPDAPGLNGASLSSAESLPTCAASTSCRFSRSFSWISASVGSRVTKAWPRATFAPTSTSMLLTTPRSKGWTTIGRSVVTVLP